MSVRNQVKMPLSKSDTRVTEQVHFTKYRELLANHQMNIKTLYSFHFDYYFANMNVFIKDKSDPEMIDASCGTFT